MPKVSVVIPAYNVGPYIRQTVDSVLDQTYGDVECIVVNDGSTDETEAILRTYENRIIYLGTDNRGRSAARNQGLRLARGDYLAFLDADDYWAPLKLEEQVAYLETHPSTGAVGCGAYLVTKTGQIVRELVAAPGASLEAGGAGIAQILTLDYWMAAPLSTLVIRAECLRQPTPLDESINTMEEWSLLLRIVEEWDLGCVMKPLAYYRSYGLYTPEKVAPRRRQDKYIEVIQRALEQFDGVPEVREASANALGLGYLRGALLECAIGADAAASTRLEAAASHAPWLFSDPNPPFIVHAAYFATSLYDDVTPLDESVRFAHQLLSCMPSSTRGDLEHSEDLLKQIHLVWLFDCYRRHAMRDIRTNIPYLLRVAPRVFQHPGTPGIALESIVGSSTMATLRRIKKQWRVG